MCHVLIIEDDFLIADELAAIATEAGASSIAVVRTPSEALDSATQRLPAVVLSDVQIIGGTGPEAVTAIRRRLGFVPVIFITGNPEACEGYEATAVLLKPIMREILFTTFQSVAPKMGPFNC